MEMLRLRDVTKKTGLSRSTIYALIRQKKFPPQIELGPKSVGWIAEQVDGWLREIVEEEMAAFEPEYLRLSQNQNPDTLYEFVLKNYGHYINNTGLRVLMKALMNEEIIQIVYDMEWGIRYVKPENTDLEFLMCDRPLVIEGDLRNDNSALYIPISPKALFYAVKTPKQEEVVRRFPVRKFVHRVNKKLLSQTDKFVLGQTHSNSPIIKKYFMHKAKML